MKRKKLIKTVNKLSERYRLTGIGGVFEIVSLLSNKSPKTIQTYFYSDKSRPFRKSKKA